MVIERALEKLRAAQAAAPAGMKRAGDERRASDDRRRLPPAAPLRERPAFPTLSVGQTVAEAHRILVSGVTGPGEGSADAAYRMLRTRLVQKLRNNRWTSLAITSPGAGEGKSVTTLNLALSMARDKANDVYLLDLDLRNPSICKSLDVVPPHELVSYFGGAGEPSETLFSIGPANLAIAGSTEPSVHASELLASGRFEELIAYISSISASPIVLIDLPPLLATDEALLMAPRVDATVLVVAEGRTRRDSLARARQLLADYTFAGAILNCSTETFGAERYYGYGYAHLSGQKT
jgi:protein-tyrosine kinase